MAAVDKEKGQKKESEGEMGGVEKREREGTTTGYKKEATRPPVMYIPDTDSRFD